MYLIVLVCNEAKELKDILVPITASLYINLEICANQT